MADSPLYTDQLSALSRTPVTLVAIHLDACIRSFGAGPCLGSGAPCYNTWGTCKYPSAFSSAPQTYKFHSAEAPPPLPGQVVRPYLETEQSLAQEIVLNEGLIINDRVALTLYDAPDDDTLTDPYRVSPTLRSAVGGTENSVAQGTFWRKLRARNPHYKNRRIEIKRGFVAPGFGEADYKTVFVGVIENIDLDAKGKAKVSATGLLKLTDTDLPQKTDGRLSDILTDSATTFDLAPWSGVDTFTLASKYAATGYIMVEAEIMSYASLSLDTATGITTFSGLARGLYIDDGWSPGAVHAADKSVQQVDVSTGNPIDIMHSLLNRSGITNADIDIAGFALVRDQWFTGVTFRGILWEPTKIKTLLKELREQTGCYLYQGEDNLIHIGIISPITPGKTYTQITDEANIIYESRSFGDHEEKLITRAAIYYDINPQTKGNDTLDYRLATVVIDANAESAKEYNEVKPHSPILSRWMRSYLGANDYSRTIAARLVRRLRDGQRTIAMRLERKDEAVRVGDVVEITTSAISGVDGAPSTMRALVIKKETTRGGTFRISAVDTKLDGRYAWIAPTGTPDYTSATSAQRDNAYICDSISGLMSNGDSPYNII